MGAAASTLPPPRSGWLSRRQELFLSVSASATIDLSHAQLHCRLTSGCDCFRPSSKHPYVGSKRGGTSSQFRRASARPTPTVAHHPLCLSQGVLDWQSVNHRRPLRAVPRYSKMCVLHSYHLLGDTMKLWYKSAQRETLLHPSLT